MSNGDARPEYGRRSAAVVERCGRGGGGEETEKRQSNETTDVELRAVPDRDDDDAYGDNDDRQTAGTSVEL